MALTSNQIYQGDCRERLAQLAEESIDLVFADPPFNIGYQYDVYDDRRTADEYLEWSRRWIAGVHRALKPTGTFWLAIGDEFAAELKVLAQRDLGFHCRSWVIWYYTFGVNCVRAFSRSHTHLLHFVKDPREFTFNADDPALRVPSARQLVYGDSRANPKGRLPDNTWILRPQDAAGGFTPEHDTWYYPRVAGTFKEREGFHGCQMPEQLLGRIIRCSSCPGDVVLDPFSGSGTTLAVAKKLGRKWLGFELSEDYVERIKQRLKAARPDGELDGVADPLTSVPPTHLGRRLGERKGREKGEGGRGKERVQGSGFRVQENKEPAASGFAGTADSLPSAPVLRSSKPARKPRSGPMPLDLADGVLAAFKETHAGQSVDHLLADPGRSAAFIDACKRRSLLGTPVEWNHALMRIRKSGKLPHVPSRERTLTFQQMDAYSFAAEIAMQQIAAECDASIDDILCDPTMAARFDGLAAALAPGYSPFEYRWAALAIRKRAKKAKRLAELHGDEWKRLRLSRTKPLADGSWDPPGGPGVYLVLNSAGKKLYVGETINLPRRVAMMRGNDVWRSLRAQGVQLLSHDKSFGLQAHLVQRHRPRLNSMLLVDEGL